MEIEEWSDRLAQPDLQELTVVLSRGVPHDDRPCALQLQLAGDTVPSHLAVPVLLSAIDEIGGPQPMDLRETRKQHDWGAEGPIVHEVLIWISDSILSGMAWDAIKAALWAAIGAAIKKGLDDFYVDEVKTLEIAWDRVERFLTKSFDPESIDMQSCEFDEDRRVWVVIAKVDYKIYRAEIGADGAMLSATRIE